jgi:hypothetical protein
MNFYNRVYTLVKIIKGEYSCCLFRCCKPSLRQVKMLKCYYFNQCINTVKIMLFSFYYLTIVPIDVKMCILKY